MSNILEETVTGREIARKNREEGRAEGIDEGRVESMRKLLRAKYGDIADLDDLAKRLVDQDHDGNIARVVEGVTLDELRA